MRTVQIPKGKGKFRTIYVPSDKEKADLRELVPILAKMERDRARHFDVSNVAHGFVCGRSPTTCALMHVGYEITCSFDLESWFDSVTTSHLINAGVDEAMAHAITIDGALRQGLPTSPVAANLAAVNFDKHVFQLLRRQFGEGDFIQFCYTRYADDITISFKRGLSSSTTSTQADISAFADMAGATLASVVQTFGWKIAEHKTHIQTAKGGRRIIVGVSVGPTDIQPTRKTKRRLRAAKHKKNAKQIRGLTEWAALKLPRAARGHRRIAGVTPGLMSAPAFAKPTPDDSVTVATPTRRLTFD